MVDISSIPLVRVFVNKDGKYGDLASVCIDDGRKISDKERQGIAKEVNTGETIFIDDEAKANISIVHPQGEIDFAGVGLLGAAWFLSKRRGELVQSLHGRNGEIRFWQEGEINWTSANRKSMPAWNFKEVVSSHEVESINVADTENILHTMFWAWIDEDKGRIRARTFAKDWDIPEAEGNGSGAMLLAAKLGREIQIVHGKGSIMYARPAEDQFGSIGGRIIMPTFQVG